jgi:hypothetical protein
MDNASPLYRGELATLIANTKGAESTALQGESKKFDNAIGSDINGNLSVGRLQRDRIVSALEAAVQTCNSLGLSVTGVEGSTTRRLLNNSPVNARDLSLDGRELMGARTQRIQP